MYFPTFTHGLRLEGVVSWLWEYMRWWNGGILIGRVIRLSAAGVWLLAFEPGNEGAFYIGLSV